MREDYKVREGYKVRKAKGYELGKVWIGYIMNWVKYGLGKKVQLC